MRHVLAMLCSVLIWGCGVEEGIGAHAVWITTPDGGACADVVCDAIGVVGDPCCPSASNPQPKITNASPLGAIVQSGWFHDLSRGGLYSFGSGAVMIPLAMDDGERLVSLSVTAKGNESADLVFGVFRSNPYDATVTLLGSRSVPNAPAVFGSVVIDIADAAPLVAPLGVSTWLTIEADQSGASIGAIRFTHAP
jgi:hypothetical protein